MSRARPDRRRQTAAPLAGQVCPWRAATPEACVADVDTAAPAPAPRTCFERSGPTFRPERCTVRRGRVAWQRATCSSRRPSHHTSAAVGSRSGLAAPVQHGEPLGGGDQVRPGPAHSVATLDLPPLHKDPFDRMLVARAQVEGLALVTSDESVARYAGNILKV